MFKVKKIAKSLGAELHGVDLCKDLPDEIYAEIRKLLIEHQVIFFRDQDISPQQHKSLAESFGPLQTHPAYETVEGYPEITILESTAEKPSKIEVWHSDMTFRKHPPLGSVLRAKICPPKGGDTMWASMSAAYDGLSKGLQEFLSTLNAEHDFSYGFKESLAEPGGKERLAKAVEDNPPVLHPVIRIHPESNQKVIFVNALFTTKIIGLPEKESSAILEFLYDHIISQEYTCRFHWEPNSIAIWDNRSTQHKPINDYFPAHRLLERIAIDGDKHY